MASELEKPNAIGFDQVIAALSQFDAGELVELLDKASTMLKKVHARGPPKKKAGAPQPQLERNQEWVKYVLADATMNGWESFVARTSKLNKETNQKVFLEVTLRESVKTANGHVFADTGKHMSQGQAMCYAALLRKDKPAEYAEFSEQYDNVVEPKMVEKKEKVVVKVTSEQVERERALEKIRKEQEKEAEKKRKEAEKEEKKKKEKSPVVKGKPPVVTPKLRSSASEVEVKELPAVDPFVPAETGLKKWIWKDVLHLRDGENYVWLVNADTQQMGAFQGRYNYKEDKMEECTEPEFDD